MSEKFAGFAAPSDTMSYAVADDLTTVRRFVRSLALALGLSASRTDLLVLAVSELATNTLQHTTGGGLVRVWADAGQLICDVVDGGQAWAFGRGMPPADSVGGRGLAIVELVSDDVVATAGPEGTMIRIRLDL
jgi:anti-sigma regulatory factor (Ser/Thr protein kinase)